MLAQCTDNKINNAGYSLPYMPNPPMTEKLDWSTYSADRFYDELINAQHLPQPGANELVNFLSNLGVARLAERQAAAERAIVEMGITFTVYTEGSNVDRAWPFDVIPRVISGIEWDQTRWGLIQRVKALNHFIDDIYHDQRIFKDGIIPRWVIETSGMQLKPCAGINPAYNIWAHICGSDLVRDSDGTLFVLEDNLRVPSGVSYMMENRIVMKEVFSDLFAQNSIRPVEDYGSALFNMLSSLSPRSGDEPEVVVLTPGIYNSAYFEHAYLAQRMGAELVEGADLVVGDDDCVYMKAIQGLVRVDVIYTRVNAEFLDPEAFRPDSVLGVPGLIRAWRAGNVALANAPGTGVADDKVVYAYVPDMIRYYLGEEAILPNVPTWLCSDDKSREHVLANLDKLVVKPANESGGYGMLVGPHSTKAEQAKFKDLIKANPRNYVAQPTLALSTAPTLVGDSAVEPRHVDMRPFILQGSHSYVTPGGLTRVALRKGSLVVNSSQGGGSKDTWVVDS
jgi:uncharacterized circularly permuted ATP-grasp superfamily protein